MCTSTPNIPPPPPPPPPVQEQKQPDTMSTRRKNNKVGVGAGTLLTSPSGVASNSLNVGGNTLLGG